jgi:TonB family protein
MRALIVAAAVLFPGALYSQRHCEPARTPDPLPMAMQLVDSSALAASIPDRVLPPTTFTLWYDSTGQLTNAMALSDSLVARGASPPDTGALARAALGVRIADAAFPQDSGKTMTVRLTLARSSAGGVSLSVARSVVCSARARLAPRVPNQRTSATRDDIDELRRASTSTVSFVVDTTGHPIELQLLQSSGSRLMDSHLIESIQSNTYEPAAIDGFAKRVTIVLRVSPPRIGP